MRPPDTGSARNGVDVVGMDKGEWDAHTPGARGASLGPARTPDPTGDAQNASRDLMSPPGAVWCCLGRRIELPDLVPPDLVSLPSDKKGQTRSVDLFRAAPHPAPRGSPDQRVVSLFAVSLLRFLAVERVRARTKTTKNGTRRLESDRK